jgi:hypothetical protein
VKFVPPEPISHKIWSVRTFSVKSSSWNIFHRKSYSAYVKFILVSISRPTVKFVSEWTLQKQKLVSLFVKQCEICQRQNKKAKTAVPVLNSVSIGQGVFGGK